MRVFASLVLLLLVTAGVYSAVLGHDFIIVDDPQYTFMNPWVAEGLTSTGTLWAFTTFDAFNWHPLTWLSLMADVEIFGPEPAAAHGVNLLLHLIATLLAFLSLRKLTGRPWESLAVAALFALHPLHVESVAWVAERKDVLSACFWFLTLWAYGHYAARPNIGRYLLLTVSFLGGLLSKPMVVTLPFVLLLLDAWPLHRAQSRDVRRWTSLVLEKIPLIIMAALASLITLEAQQPGVAHTPETLPLWSRVGNALVAYETYLELTFWPQDLAILYPHPRSVATVALVVAILVLSIICWVAWHERTRRPYLAVGWLYFLGTLIPVIGLVQVGDQALADRYTYLPHIGLFLMLCWTVGDLVRAGKLSTTYVTATSVLILGLLAGRTHAQVALWENTETLFRHTLAVTQNNPFAHFSLATVLLIEERNEEATRHLEAAIAIDPNHAEALNGLGNLRLQAGSPEQALDLYRRAVESGPWLYEAQVNTGLMLENRGEFRAALPFYRAAAKLEPFHPAVQVRLGATLENLASYRRAAAHYRRARKLDPEMEEAREGLRRVRPHLRGKNQNRSRTGDS